MAVDWIFFPYILKVPENVCSKIMAFGLFAVLVYLLTSGVMLSGGAEEL